MRTFDSWNRYLDNNNKPLHGCVQFMVKDGNTVAAIFDVDGTALDNPIITDEYGRTQHQVCVNEDVVAYFYKYVGNGIWSDELDIDTSDVSKWALQYTSESIDQSTLHISADSIYCVDKIADLRNIDTNIVPEINGNKIITLLGYYAVGDKEPVNYIWDEHSLDTDDNGAVIATQSLMGRWKIVQPTEHLDVRHYGVFPSATQNMTDQSDRIRQALTYANSKGIRLFFDKNTDVQTYNYYRISGVFTVSEPIDVSANVRFIDDSVNIVSSRNNAFNGDPYFINNDTALTANYAKSSWNISQLVKANVNADATYVIDSNTHYIDRFTGWNVVVMTTVHDCDFTLCNISGIGYITDTVFNTCTFNVTGTIGNGCSFSNCNVNELMFNSSPSVITVNNCIADIDDFTHKLSLWQKFHRLESLDYENLPNALTEVQPFAPDSDYSISNFIGNAAMTAEAAHTYTLNHCSGHIGILNANNSTFIIDNCNVELEFNVADATQHIVVKNSTVSFTQDLVNTVLDCVNSKISIKDVKHITADNTEFTSTSEVRTEYIKATYSSICNIRAAQAVLTHCDLHDLTLFGITDDAVYVPLPNSEAQYVVTRFVTGTVTHCDVFGTLTLGITDSQDADYTTNWLARDLVITHCHGHKDSSIAINRGYATNDESYNVYTYSDNTGTLAFKNKVTIPAYTEGQTGLSVYSDCLCVVTDINYSGYAAQIDLFSIGTYNVTVDVHTIVYRLEVGLSALMGINTNLSSEIRFARVNIRKTANTSWTWDLLNAAVGAGNLLSLTSATIDINQI